MVGGSVAAEGCYGARSTMDGPVKPGHDDKEELRAEGLLPTQPQSQRVQFDEPFGIALVVDRIGLEGDDVLLVEALG